MNIEQVVAEMPKPENPHHVVYPSESKGYVMASLETLTTRLRRFTMLLRKAQMPEQGFWRSWSIGKCRFGKR